MIRILIVFFICFFSFSRALELSEKEKLFIKEHPIITLGGDAKWVPYTFKKKDGSIEGYDKDILDEINNLTGANFQLQIEDWKNVEQKAKNKEIDGLTTSSIHKEREPYFNFSDPYVSHDLTVVVKYGNPKGIKSIKDLKNKTFVIQRGNLLVEKLVKKFKNINIIYKDTSEQVLFELIYGNADAAIGNGSTQYLKNEFGLPYLSQGFSLNKKHTLVFSIRKDWPEAINIINKALSNISSDKLKELKETWFEKISIKTASGLSLSKKEYNYLKNKTKVRVCSDPSWHSFLKIDKDLLKKNITIKYIDTVLNKIGLEKELIFSNSWEESILNIKEKKCDIISAIHKTTKRSEFINFTTPYIDLPVMILTKKDTPYLIDIRGLDKKKIVLLRGHTLIDILNKKYKNLEIVYVNNHIEAIKEVEKGNVYAFIELLPSIIPIMNESNNIKINRELDIHLDLSVGIRKDDLNLLSIIEKSLSSIPDVEKLRIYDSLIQVTYNEKIDFKIFIYVFILIVGIVLIVIYWNFLLKKAVKEATLKIKEKESLLYYYSKQDAMKDLIGNISHQWRQPIDELSTNLMYIETKQLLNQKISQEDIKERTQKSRNIVSFLSNTVDTFRFFYENKNESDSIFVSDLLSKTIFIIEGAFKSSGIEVKLEHIDNSLKIKGYSLQQVFLSIFNNVKNIVLERDIKNPIVNIKLYKRINSIVIEIEDNCGGIKKDTKEIFDLGKTHTKKGTGLGLYISKRIIEDKYKGSISAKNINDGIIFKIIIPISNMN